MTTATIPNLWPNDIMVDVRPPLEILKAQAANIGAMTHGILTAEVTTVTGHEDFSVHRLDLIAPKLDDRRSRVLIATHRTDFYPVVIEAELYRPKTSPIMRAIGDFTERVAEVMSEWPRNNDWRPIANNQDEFLKRVAEVLRSPAVRAVIDSMIALSNEKNLPSD